MHRRMTKWKEIKRKVKSKADTSWQNESSEHIYLGFMLPSLWENKFLLFKKKAKHRNQQSIKTKT